MNLWKRIVIALKWIKCSQGNYAIKELLKIVKYFLATFKNRNKLPPTSFLHIPVLTLFMIFFKVFVFKLDDKLSLQK